MSQQVLSEKKKRLVAGTFNCQGKSDIKDRFIIEMILNLRIDIMALQECKTGSKLYIPGYVNFSHLEKEAGR